MIKSLKKPNFSLQNGPLFNHPHDHILFWTHTKIIYMVTTDPILTQHVTKKV